jgi:uncharacterized protein
MRIVLDANVLVSAIITPKGNAAKILDLLEQGKFDLVLSQPILEEISRVIEYPRIKGKYNLPEIYVSTFLEFLNSLVIEIPQEELNIIESDPTDNRYLECALASGANTIVSGDAHLFNLGEYQGILILSPASFHAMMTNK